MEDIIIDTMIILLVFALGFMIGMTVESRENSKSSKQASEAWAVYHKHTNSYNPIDKFVVILSSGESVVIDNANSYIFDEQGFISVKDKHGKVIRMFKSASVKEVLIERKDELVNEEDE